MARDVLGAVVAEAACPACVFGAGKAAAPPSGGYGFL